MATAKSRNGKSNGHDEGVALAEKALAANGKVDWGHVDTGIEYTGSKITLPDDPSKMPIDAAIAALQRKKKDEETVLDVHEIIDAFPLDGAVAFVKALKRKYGWATSVPTPGFFGPTPPAMLTVETGPGPEDKVQVPWGGFSVPGIESPIHTDSIGTRSGSALVIYGKVRKREAHILKELADLTREIVAKESIYRSKAIRLPSNGNLTDFKNPPQFINAEAMRDDQLVLSKDVSEQVQVNLWNLIEFTDRARAAKVPLRRGILLEGKFGTGKSMVSGITAKKATRNGWTYILLDRASGLKEALEFAKRYQPAVLFTEDIDRATETRNEQANDLLNILDGVLSKNTEIMVVLTTNHVEKINQAMLRPGRLDAVISVTPPDAEAVERLLRIYGAGLIGDSETLSKVGAKLAGQIPATVREVVERAKLSAIGRNSTVVNQDDLMVAAVSMENHLSLLNRPSNVVVSPEERVGIALADVIDAKVAHAVANGLAALLANLGRRFDPIPEKNIETSATNLRALMANPSSLVEVKKVTNGSGREVTKN